MEKWLKNGKNLNQIHITQFYKHHKKKKKKRRNLKILM